MIAPPKKRLVFDRRGRERWLEASPPCSFSLASEHSKIYEQLKTGR